MKSKNFEDVLKARINKEDLKLLQSQARLEIEAMIALRKDIANAIEKHMKKTGIGFNELTKKLGISPSQAAKIKRAEANLTVASIAHIAAFIGKKPHLTFD